jgi:hypothetical protein
VRVLPAEPSPEHCEVAGWGLQGGVEGCSSHVLLLVRDAFGNLRGLREDKHIRLAVSANRLRAREARLRFDWVQY